MGFPPPIGTTVMDLGVPPFPPPISVQRGVQGGSPYKRCGGGSFKRPPPIQQGVEEWIMGFPPPP